MLNIAGKYDASHILGDLIAKECAFSCFWEDAELRVSHRKGTWVLLKYWDGKLVDRLEVYDIPEFHTTNKLLLGLVQSFNSMEVQDPYELDMRSRMGRVLTKTVTIWIHLPEDIKTIIVHQAGRNSWLNAEGEYSFSPDSNQ